MAAKPNYYEILDVRRNARKISIDGAYRALARYYHPDNPKGPKDEASVALFKQMTEAHDTLTDDVKRRAYDLSLGSPTGSHGTSGHYSARLIPTLPRPWQWRLPESRVIRWSMAIGLSVAVALITLLVVETWPATPTLIHAVWWGVHAIWWILIKSIHVVNVIFNAIGKLGSHPATTAR